MAAQAFIATLFVTNFVTNADPFAPRHSNEPKPLVRGYRIDSTILVGLAKVRLGHGGIAEVWRRRWSH